MFRLFRHPALAAFFVLALIAPSTASAQAAPRNAPPANVAPLDPAYDALMVAMEASVDKDAIYDATAMAVANEFGKVPEIAALEAEKPGLIDAIITAIKPVMVTYGLRVRADYRPRMLAVFARHLTPAEARDMADVYRSPLGLKLMGSVSRNLTLESTMSGVGDAVAQGKDPTLVTVDRKQIEADIGRSTGAALNEMSRDDLAAFAKLAREKPAILKMQIITRDIIPLRTAMENEGPNPEESAQLQEAVVTAMANHMKK